MRALFAEDDVILAEMIGEALVDAGFEVTRAASGDKALEVLDSGANDVKVLITDIQLGPGVDGWRLARYARTRHPDIAVLYITGNSAAQWVSQAVPGSILLQKPFEAAEVVTAARALLGAGARAMAIPDALAREIVTAISTTPDEPVAGPVFSLRKGEVWASWYEHDAEVKLGDLPEVVDMMRDFVRQTEFAERLLKSLGVQAIDKAEPGAPEG